MHIKSMQLEKIKSKNELTSLSLLSEAWFFYLKIIIHGFHSAAFFSNNSCEIKDFLKIINNLSPDSKTKLVFKKILLCPCGRKKIGSTTKCYKTLSHCFSVVGALNEEDFKDLDLKIIPTDNIFSSRSEFSRKTQEIENSLFQGKEMMKMRKQTRVNSDLMVYELKRFLRGEVLDFQFLPQGLSYNSLKALLSVSRTIADLKGSYFIEVEHVEEAKEMTVLTLKRVRDKF